MHGGYRSGGKSSGVSYRRSYGGNRSGSGSYYSGGDCFSFKCIVIFAVAFVVLCIIGFLLGSILPNVLDDSDSSSDIATNLYSPGDSRLISFSSFFCDGVNVEVDSVATGATVYIVDAPPPLTEQNNFTVTNRTTPDASNFHFWQYYLYPNSNISISVCSGRRLDVYVIKGNSNVNNWGSSPGEQHAELFDEIITTCPWQQVITYAAQEQDEYYVVLHNSLSRSQIAYTVSLSFERFEYTPPSIGSSCSALSGGQCTVDIPYGTGSQLALVVTTIPGNVDWGENVDVQTNCNRRDWAYALVILLPLLVVIVTKVIIVWYCCC